MMFNVRLVLALLFFVLFLTTLATSQGTTMPGRFQAAGSESVKEQAAKAQQDQMFKDMALQELAQEEMLKFAALKQAMDPQEMAQMNLFFAAIMGNVTMAFDALAMGADINLELPDSKVTPFALTAYYDHPEVAKYLIDNGANINHPDKYGYTPIHVAAKFGSQWVMRVLLAYEATMGYGRDGFHPIHRAAFGTKKKHVECVKLLLQAGTSPMLKSKSSPVYTPIEVSKTERVKRLIQKWIAKFEEFERREMESERLGVEDEASQGERPSIEVAEGNATVDGDSETVSAGKGDSSREGKGEEAGSEEIEEGAETSQQQVNNDNDDEHIEL